MTTPSPQENKGFTVEVSIAKPVHVVHAFLANSLNMPRWYEAVEDVRELPAETGKTRHRYRITRKLPGGRAVNEVEVTGEAPNKITVRSLSGPTPFTYRYTLDPVASATHLTLHGTITGDGLTGPAALLAPLAQPLFKQGMAKNLQALKRIVENS